MHTQGNINRKSVYIEYHYEPEFMRNNDCNRKKYRSYLDKELRRLKTKLGNSITNIRMDQECDLIITSKVNYVRVKIGMKFAINKEGYVVNIPYNYNIVHDKEYRKICSRRYFYYSNREE